MLVVGLLCLFCGGLVCFVVSDCCGLCISGGLVGFCCCVVDLWFVLICYCCLLVGGLILVAVSV